MSKIEVNIINGHFILCIPLSDNLQYVTILRAYPNQTQKGETHYFTENKELAMDKQIKKIQKKTKALEKDEMALLRMDKKHDKVIAKAKKKVKK
mgnify:CR=1 FL=1